MAGDLAGAKEFYEAGAAAGSVDCRVNLASVCLDSGDEGAAEQLYREALAEAFHLDAAQNCVEIKFRAPRAVVNLTHWLIPHRRRTSRACSRPGAATRARARPRSCCGTWCGRTRRGGTPGRIWGARSGVEINQSRRWRRISTFLSRRSHRDNVHAGALADAGAPKLDAIKCFQRGITRAEAVERDPDTPAELVEGIRRSLGEVYYGLGACLADLNSDQRFEAYGDGEVLGYKATFAIATTACGGATLLGVAIVKETTRDAARHSGAARRREDVEG